MRSFGMDDLRRVGRAGLRRIDPPLAACVAWLLLLPLVAVALAAGQPEPAPARAAAPPISRDAPHRAIRAVPIAMRGSVAPDLAALRDTEQMRRMLTAAAAPVVGRADAAGLLRLVEREESLRAGVPAFDYEEAGRYPYRFPLLDRLLDRHLRGRLDADSIAGANDLAVLLIHASAGYEFGADWDRFPQAASVAYALLHRARASGACEPQLNLAFLVSADRGTTAEVSRRELEQAADACPGDPTPLWLLGQQRSVNGFYALRDASSPPEEPSPSAGLREARETFARLRERFPGSAAGWAGAADSELRVAYEVDAIAPFTARVHFRRALALYREAQRVDPDPGLAAGEARAQAGLRRYDRAVEAQRRAIAGRADLAPLQVRLVEYLERDGRFASAAAAAAELRDAARHPVPADGYVVHGYTETPELHVENAVEALSIGADRSTAIVVDLGVLAGGGGGGAVDLGFVPTYHQVDDVTGHKRWCPAWSMVRDRILAGDARGALDAWPDRFDDVRATTDSECVTYEERIEAVAALEAGDRERALSLAREDDYYEDDYDEYDDDVLFGRVSESRVELWRFGGDLDRAQAAVLAWRDARPEDALPFERSGEIAFLQGRFALAASLFARAARNARAANGLASVAEASALLKEGAALARSGRRAQALRRFEEAEATASRAEGLIDQIDEGVDELGDTTQAAYVSYGAMAQIGEAELRAGRYRAAVAAYASARDRRLTFYGRPSRENATSTRDEVTFGNLSVAAAQLGHLRTAQQAARRARGLDPLSPLALENEAYALARLGRNREAHELLRKAVRHHPRQFVAWNDVGVVADRLGRPDEALAALRHAVAANARYGLGWFNLGVLLEQRGLLHAVAAQGAFARAAALDPQLRDRRHRLTLDHGVYLTDLDLSKPLPPDWSVASLQKRDPVEAAGLVLILLLALRLGRALAGQSAASTLAPVLEQAQALLVRVRRDRDFAPAGLAVGATLAVFLVPLLRAKADLADVVLLLAGVGALLLAVHRVRVLAARRAHVAIEQRAWRPAVVVGLVAALFGTPWAPAPVVQPAPRAASISWAGPATTALLAAGLLVESVATDVPIARMLAGVAIVMTASMLIPVAPLDGAEIARRRAGIAGGLALAGGALLLLLGLA